MLSFSKKNWSRLVDGDRRITSGEPSSMICPPSMNTTRSATLRAKPNSWVTMIIVIPFSASCFNTANTPATSSGSNAEVGSSNNIKTGSIARTRAIARRCFCPPDRLSGQSVFLSSRPTSANAESAFFSAMSRPRLATTICGQITFSRAFI